ncbi:MAG: flagellar export chaperone FliS [Oscillospiraceae bacterium]|nr:flagellar export chaperone FliS [Oscillospiraceae bacterium]
MDMRGFQQYKEQSVNTMTQGELLLLLYDELVKRVTRAELALNKEDYATLDASVDRCLDILRYLDDTLDMQYPVSGNLTKLYEYFCYELNRVKAGRNKAELARIKPMITDLRDAFREADKSCNQQLEASGEVHAAT